MASTRFAPILLLALCVAGASAARVLQQQTPGHGNGNGNGNTGNLNGLNNGNLNTGLDANGNGYGNFNGNNNQVTEVLFIILCRVACMLVSAERVKSKDGLWCARPPSRHQYRVRSPCRASATARATALAAWVSASAWQWEWTEGQGLHGCVQPVVSKRRRWRWAAGSQQCRLMPAAAAWPASASGCCS